jgi:hypothetical protein
MDAEDLCDCLGQGGVGALRCGHKRIEFPYREDPMSRGYSRGDPMAVSNRRRAFTPGEQGHVIETNILFPPSQADRGQPHFDREQQWESYADVSGRRTLQLEMPERDDPVPRKRETHRGEFFAEPLREFDRHYDYVSSRATNGLREHLSTTESPFALSSGKGFHEATPFDWDDKGNYVGRMGYGDGHYKEYRPMDNNRRIIYMGPTGPRRRVKGKTHALRPAPPTPEVQNNLLSIGRIREPSNVCVSRFRRDPHNYTGGNIRDRLARPLNVARREQFRDGGALSKCTTRAQLEAELDRQTEAALGGRFG